jgi:hypothetical protein
MEKNWDNTIPARDASKCAGQLVKLTSPVFGVFVVCFGCFFLKFLCKSLPKPFFAYRKDWSRVGVATL